jgi:hypothetical protein
MKKLLKTEFYIRMKMSVIEACAVGGRLCAVFSNTKNTTEHEVHNVSVSYSFFVRVVVRCVLRDPIREEHRVDVKTNS